MEKKINNLLNLIILLLLVCIIYQVLMYFKKDNYQQISGKLIIDISQIGYPDNGFTIQESSSQKYLKHSSDNSNDILRFDTNNIKKETYKSLSYDMCKFEFVPYKPEEGQYFIKSSGPIDPKVGDNYISSSSQYGLKNPKPNISSQSEAINGIDNRTSIFVIKSTGSDYSYLINQQVYKIKPYIPDSAKTLNEYSLKYSIEKHQSLEGKNRCNGDKMLDTYNNSKIEECLQKCDNRSDCNNIQYYYKKKDEDTPGGTCILYDDCNEDMEIGGENSVIYDKSDIRKKMLEKRENRYRILGIKNKNYQKVIKLIEDNKKKALEIADTIKEIDNLKHYSPGHSQKIINEHKEIVDLIEDPSRIKSFKYKIEQDVQDMKIEELEKDLAKLQDQRLKSNLKYNRNNSTEIHGVKSFDNSQILNVYPGNEEINYDGKNYMIFGNGGCLSYNQKINDKGSTNQYAFTHCNVQNPQQQFKIKKINNRVVYNDNVYSDIDKVSTDTEFVNYGFNIIKPTNINDNAKFSDEDKQCLSLNENGLSIEPCTLEPRQRFSTVNSVTSC